MFSAIYRGTLRHRRFYPKAHAFTYDSTLFYIDLDELPQLFEGVTGWSVDGKTLGRFRRQDYLGDPRSELKQAVRAEVVRQRGSCPQGAVRMLTNLRMWGFCFNPVTLYYLFELDADTPALILAQVNNTPWNERHSYIIPCDEGGKTQVAFAKQFHVSPFNPLDMQYHWVSTTPAEHLLVHMENHRAEVCHMDATLTLERHPWSARQLQRILWRQPWLTLKVPVMIYWQALKLLIKGVPFYSHSVSAGEDKGNPQPVVIQRNISNR
jgi:DUF1365 family protein